MGIIVRESIKNTITSYLGIILGFISTIQLFPNILSPEEFGLTRIIVAIVALSTQFVNIGLPSSIIKFYPELKEKTKSPSSTIWFFIVPQFFCFISLTSLIIFFKPQLISLFNDDNSLLTEYYFLIPLMLLFIASFDLLNAYIKANLSTFFPSFLQDILVRIIVIIDLFLFTLNLIDFNSFMLIFIINYAIQYIVLFTYAVIKKYISFTIPKKIFYKELVSRIRIYSLYSFFGGITMVVVGNIDLIMVGTFEGLSSTGVYSIALYVGSVIAVPRKSIAKITLPVLANSFRNKDRSNIISIYRKSSLNLLLIGLLLYIGIIANIDNLYAFMPSAYSEGSLIIIILGFAHLFNMACGANGQIITTSEYFRFDFYSSIILIFLTIILNLILIPIYGIDGAAIATALSLISFNSIKLIYVWRKLQIHPFSFQHVWLIFTGVLILFVSLHIKNLDNHYLDILLRSFAITTVYVAFTFKIKISEDFNTLISNLVRKISFFNRGSNS